MATTSYKCPNCGASLLFNPEKQKLVCDYCLSTFSVEELERKTLSEEAKPSPGLVVYHCDNCGAEVVTEETTTASFCYYCHNPVLISERLTGSYRPQIVIPFAFGKDKAVDIFKNWAHGRRYVPRDFLSASQLEKITGLYLPCWMADYQADVDFAGTAVNRRVWVAGNREYTEHQEYTVLRKGSVCVHHVYELALQKFDKQLIDAVTPYDESRAVNFALPYLSGFFAETYDIKQADVQPMVEDRIRQYAETLVRETIGTYQQINLTKTDLHLIPEKWSFALLPVWILTYFYKGKTYIYAINGQTGKIHGTLPVDQKHLSLESLLIAACLFILLILGGLFLW
ncbi:MAG: hypothetical protein KBG64_00525 [Clostridia bacterium]|nr:hypothetical protein [Clostridia bacterium]